MLRRLLKAFGVDARGGVAIISAVSMTACLCAAGIVTDTALIYLHKRKAQGATDLAALVAARSLALAERAASASLSDNGFPAPDLVEVATGRYEADPVVAAGTRFVAGAEPVNAVHVRMVSPAPVVLWRVFVDDAAPRVTTEAVAATSGIASLSIGSRLASLDGGVLNALLGRLLGAGISLDVMDYEALLDAEVDMLDVLDALAVDLGLAGDGYSDLMDLTVGPADLGDALASVLEGLGGHSRAARAARSIPDGSNGEIALSDLIDLGPIAGASVGGGRGGLSATASALEIVSAAARLAGGSSAIDVTTGLSLPGLGGVEVRLLVGEPMQGSAWMEVGDGGTRVHTAQTRLLLKAQIGGSGVLSAVSLSVPLYLEVAAGVAELKTIACGTWSHDDTRVTVSARPGLADLWLGRVDEDDLPHFGTDPAPRRARLVSAPLLKVEAFSHVEVANPSAHTLTFTKREIDAGAVKTVGTTSLAAPAIASLLGNADIRVEALGLGLGLPGGLTDLVGGVLVGVAAPLDQVLVSVLRIAGVGLGELDVRVGGVRCDGSVLVF